MNPEDYTELRRAAIMMAATRSILEGIYDSMDSADPLHEALSMLASDATYLEYKLDHLVELNRE